MRDSSVGAVLCWLVGCTENPAPLNASEATPPADFARHGVIPERVVAPKAPVVPISPEAIGIAGVPRISAAARKENGAALSRHRAGDYANAREGFARAIEISPDHDLARFNLACALSRLGELDAAHQQLSTVLHRDLLRFQERWRGPEADPDLDALRVSAHAPELDALVRRLGEAYDAAHDRGIPAYLYERPPVWAMIDYGGKVTPGGSSSLLAGVWLHDAGRFVPLARGGTLALLDLPRRRMIRAETSRTERHCHMEVNVTSLELLSTDPDPAAREKGSRSRNVDLPGAREDVAGPQGDMSLAFEGDGVRLHLSWLTWPDDTAAEGGARGGTWIELLAEGARFHAPAPEGYALQDRELTVPGRPDPIVLDRAYDNVFVPVGPDAPLFVMQRRFGFDDDLCEPLSETTVVRVDVPTGATERVAHDGGSGWVVVGPDGAVYVETGGRTQRFATPDAAAPEPTIRGLHLTMPVDLPYGGCCG